MKHAFLIMAHKNYTQVDRLIDLLDHNDIDIFIHIDYKSDSYILPVCKKSRLIQISSMNTNWGGYSLVECELRLIEEALLHGPYSYIHLISGQDLPIKPIDEILSFFDSNNQRNYIHFNTPARSINDCSRVKYYYPFQDIRHRIIWRICQKAFLVVQKCFRIDRTRQYDVVFKSGSQWWSIRTDLAEYIVSKRELIHDLFAFTALCDEMFVQTLVYNSNFYNTVFIGEEYEKRSNQRLIVFSQGRPHIWTMDDVDEIKNSDLLFARIFDENVDSEIIDEIVKMVTRKGDTNC